MPALISETDPWANGVLNHEAHSRLVQRKDEFASDAGIPASFIWTPLEATCPTEAEQVWVRQFRRHRQEGYSGLLYLGIGFEPTLEVRMCGIAGALLRNFIRARVMSMETVYQTMRQGETPEATCLLLPTFADSKPDDRRSGLVSDLVMERWHTQGSQTVVRATSYDQLGAVYGSFVRDHIRAHYVVVHGAKK